MTEPSATRADRWRWHSLLMLRRVFAQYLGASEKRKDSTDKSRAITDKLRGPIIWLGNPRSQEEDEENN